jgi:hypothetical protein
MAVRGGAIGIGKVGGGWMRGGIGVGTGGGSGIWAGVEMRLLLFSAGAVARCGGKGGGGGSMYSGGIGSTVVGPAIVRVGSAPCASPCMRSNASSNSPESSSSAAPAGH